MSVLCYACRRASDNTTQRALHSFFKRDGHSGGDDRETAGASDAVSTSSDDHLCCSKCRRVMAKRQPAPVNHSRVLPQISRIRSYQRVAAEANVPFVISEHAAAGMMLEPCLMCGLAAPAEGHGLTRLRSWPESVPRPEGRGKFFMGPFHPENLATACAHCNLAKGHRRVREYVEACRHIATHRGDAGDYGRYPHRFRDNVSKRSRSSYIAASSTHSKTHALTNEVFNEITSRPCRYCGKVSDPPRHYNGLDRIDNSVRVYNEETCDACCGDCNVMKYNHPEDRFIAKCIAVARHNVGVDEFVGDIDGQEGGCEAGEDGHRELNVAHGWKEDESGTGSGSGAGHGAGGTRSIVAWDTWEMGEEEEEEGEDRALEAEVNPFAAFAFSHSTI